MCLELSLRHEGAFFTRVKIHVEFHSNDGSEGSELIMDLIIST